MKVRKVIGGIILCGAVVVLLGQAQQNGWFHKGVLTAQVNLVIRTFFPSYAPEKKKPSVTVVERQKSAIATKEKKNQQDKQRSLHTVVNSLYPYSASTPYCNGKLLSPWEIHEKARMEQILDQQNVDIIVVPIHEDSAENDRVGRLLAARYIADQIHLRTGKNVLSPEIIQRWMGDYEINIAPEQILQIAKKKGAEVIFLYFQKQWVRNKGQEEKCCLTLVAIRVKKDGTLIKDTRNEILLANYAQHINDWKKWTSDPFPALDIATYTHRKEIVAGLFPEASPPMKTAQKVAVPDFWELPEKISEIPSLAKTPLDTAVYLQFLALCTPKNLENERHRLFERSLMALDDVDESTPYYNFLRARALFHLYRRPWALALLEKETTPAAKCLQEVMNGNYENAKNLEQDILDPVFLTMATIERHQLFYAYNKGNEQTKAYKVPSVGWVAFMDFSNHQEDQWYAPSLLHLFTSFEGLYPAFDTSFSTALRGRSLVNIDGNEGQEEKLIAEIFQLPQGIAEEENDASYGATLNQADIWQLYRNIALSAMLKEIYRTGWTQGLYETALQHMDIVTPYLGGSMLFESYRTFFLSELVQHASGEQRKVFEGKLTAAINDVYNHVCEKNSAWYNIDWTRSHLRQANVCQTIHRDAFARMVQGSYPSGLEYSTTEYNLLRNFPFSQQDIDAAKVYAEEVLTVPEAEKMFTTRFLGHPKRLSQYAKYLIEKNENEQAIKILQKAVESGAEEWETYSLLAEKYVAKKEIDKATATLNTYPSFLDPDKAEPVRLTTYAYSAGKMLYDVKAYKESRHFFELAAALGTGSHRMYLAIEHLALMDKDYFTALQANLLSAQRYSDKSAWKNVLSWMHAFNLHEDANAAYTQLAQQQDGVIYYEEAQMIGMRMAQTDMGQPPQTVVFAAQNAIIDRSAKDIETAAAALHWSSLQQTTNHGIIGTWHTQYNETLEVTSELSRIYAIKDKSQPASGCPYPWYCHLAALFHSQQYPALKTTWLQALTHNRKDKFDKDTILFVLPYLAAAMVKEDTIADINSMQEVFYKNALAKNVNLSYEFKFADAILLAGLGDMDGSVAILTKACEENFLEQIPNTAISPLQPYYQLLEVGEWLYQEYHDKRFLSLCQEVAQHEVETTPYLSWAHSFLAKYGDNEKTRVENAAFAAYLDPHSYWLSQTAPDIQKKGTQWWQEHNPFIIPEQNSPEKKSI